MELESVKLETTWNEAARVINENSQRIKTEITRLKAESGGGDSPDGDYVLRSGDSMTGSLRIQAQDTQLHIIGDKNEAGDYRAQITAGRVGEFYGGIYWNSDYTNIEGASGQLTYNDEPLATEIYVNDAINSIQGGGGGLVATTYAELWDMRDRNRLTPGAFYRITDYEAFTTAKETSASTHQFDLIVLATSTRDLSEECRAVHHAGDQYFAKSNLSAWRVWYSIDNDTNRFAWADENGKGVIYRLIDEWGNDCPYDFKNIRFKRYRVLESYSSVTDIANLYIGVNHNGQIGPPDTDIDVNDWIWAYTFHADLSSDVSGDASLGGVADNIVEPTFIIGDKCEIPNIVIGGNGAQGNRVSGSEASTIYDGSNNIITKSSSFVFLCYCYNTTIESSSAVVMTASENNRVVNCDYVYVPDGYDNDFDTVNYLPMGRYCRGNKVSKHSSGVSFGEGCDFNFVGPKVCGATFYNDSSNNEIGAGCLWVNINGNENKVEECCQTVDLVLGEKPMLGCVVKKYNTFIDGGSFNRNYLDTAQGSEYRYSPITDVLYNLELEDTLVGNDDTAIKFRFKPIKVYDPKKSIIPTDAVWVLGADVWADGVENTICDISVDSTTGEAIIMIDIELSDPTGFSMSEEIGIGTYLMLTTSFGEEVYGILEGGVTEEATLWGEVYLPNPLY